MKKEITFSLLFLNAFMFFCISDVFAADIELSYFNLSPGTKYSISTSGSKISISGGFSNVGSVVSDDSSFLNLYFETQGHISAFYSGNTFGAPIVVRLNVNSNGNGIWLVQLPFKNSIDLNQTLLFNGTLTLKSDFNYNFYGTYIASTIGTMPYDEKYTDQFENIGFQLDKILEAIKQQNSNNNTSSITSNQQIQIQQQAQIIQQNEETKKKLDEIQNSDISDQDKELPDDSKYQDYESAESDLKDKINQADMSVLEIGIDENSSLFIWDTITKFIKSHTAVFGMFISILTIGIIKLALGR